MVAVLLRVSVNCQRSSLHHNLRDLRRSNKKLLNVPLLLSEASCDMVVERVNLRLL